MRKEDLLTIEGMSEDLAKKIAEMSKKELEGFVPKSRFDEVNEAKKNAESLVKERDTQLEELKKSTGDNAELKKQIEDLQTANKEAVKAKDAEIRQLKINNAVELALKDAGALNNKAVIPFLDVDKIELDKDGNVIGLKEKIDTVKKDNAFLFKTDAKPAGAVGNTPQNGNKPSSITKEDFNKMGYKERTELYNTNKELYNSLVGNVEKGE